MSAELILTHGKLYTVDPAHPWVEAVAVVGERIVAVGTGREMESWTGPETRVIDLKGRFVLPGFIDSHVQLITGGQSLLSAPSPDPGPGKTVATWASAQLREAAEAALRVATAKGVTTLHDVSGQVGFEAYQELLGAGQLSVRIAFYLPILAVDQVRKLNLRSGFGSTRLRFAGLKGQADGALGAGTALLFKPYTDDPRNQGQFRDQMFPKGVMRERILAADSGGLRVAVHAVGDRAVATMLDIFQEVAGTDGNQDRRFRIEHAQHVRPGDLDRFARQRVIASVQPCGVIEDGRWIEGRIGRERALWSYPFRSFLDAGVRMAFGSDWPAYPMDPILGIYAAVTRRTLDGQHPDGWIPSQKIPLEAAIHAATLGGAYAESAEQEKGSLTPGKLADFVVLDRNLFELPPEQIRDARVLMTICGGSVVFHDLGLNINGK